MIPLWLAGCHPAPSPRAHPTVAASDTGSTPSIVDTATGTDSADSGSTAGTGDTGLEPIPTDLYWDWDGRTATWSGYLMLYSGISVIPDYGTIEGSSLFALFYTPGVTGSDKFLEVVYDPLSGIDDCGLRAESATGFTVPPTGPEPVFQTAGVVTATLPDGTELDLPPYAFGGYQAEPADPPQYGGTYALTTTGGDSAAFGPQDLATQPERLEITSPSLDPTGLSATTDTEFLWTGTSSTPVRLTFNGRDGNRYWYLECDWNDDGEATLPAALVARIPPDVESTWLELGRVDVTETTLSDGRILGGIGLAQFYVSGVTIR